jgi:hypothetical protein
MPANAACQSIFPSANANVNTFATDNGRAQFVLSTDSNEKQPNETSNKSPTFMLPLHGIKTGDQKFQMHSNTGRPGHHSTD